MFATQSLPEVQIVRSKKRKTMCIQVKSDASLVARVPFFTPKFVVRAFIYQNKEWIQKSIDQQQKRSKTPELSRQAIEGLILKAKHYIIPRTQELAALYGFRPSSIRITKAKRRWGSCSTKGRLNFSCRLALLPPHLIDYVIIHELSHLIEMNHSKAFWTIVEKMMPDYRVREKEIKDLSPSLPSI